MATRYEQRVVLSLANWSGIPAGNTWGGQGQYCWLQFNDPATTVINTKQYALNPFRFG